MERASTEAEQAVTDSFRREEITATLNSLYAPYGLETHPFKIGWYNEKVDSAYQFGLHPDTLAYVVISTPDMFENAFVPFICRDDCVGSLDLLDKCMQHYFALARKAFPDEDVEVIHDFEMTPKRRARILVQTACHVAGAAYYYTRKTLNPDPFEGKLIYGACVHPKYGGWFAIRGVLIFKSVQCPDLPYTEPVDCLPGQEERAELLSLFTHHWRDWRYRDMVKAEKKYSEDQKTYFATVPKDRKPLIMELREKYSKKLENSEHLNGLKEKNREDNIVNGRNFSNYNLEKNGHVIIPEIF